jgi:hypothetical protein
LPRGARHAVPPPLDEEKAGARRCGAGRRHRQAQIHKAKDATEAPRRAHPFRQHMSALLNQQRRPPVSSSSTHASKRPRLAPSSSSLLSSLSLSSSSRRPAVHPGAKGSTAAETSSSMASLPPIIPVANVPAAPARAPSAGGATNASVDPEDLRQTANVTVDSIPTYLKKDCVLFYAPECEPLARKIAETSGGSVELGRIRWRYVAFRLSSDGRRRRSLLQRRQERPSPKRPPSRLPST